MPDTPPAEMLRSAAKLMRERAAAVPQDRWAGHPWAVTECSDPQAGDCPCIVYQGEYKPWHEPQGTPIQYVCDAESPEHAAHIAGMHPGVALAVADWLDTEAHMADLRGNSAEGQTFHALAVARTYLGKTA